MFSKTWLINLILSVLVVLLGIKTYAVWSKEPMEVPKAQDVKHSLPVSKKTLADMNTPGESEYDSVVDNNLFWKSRTPYLEGEKESKAERKKAAGPDPKTLRVFQELVKRISIYGVIMTDGEKKALIKSPELPVLKKERNHTRMKAAGDSTKWVKVGDPVNRFTVKEIRPNAVILDGGGTAFEIFMYDADKPKQRAPEKKLSGPVLIDTARDSKAVVTPKRAAVPEKNGSPQSKLPTKAEKKLPVQNSTKRTEPKKR